MTIIPIRDRAHWLALRTHVRFAKKFVPDDGGGCWLWKASKCSSG